MVLPNNWEESEMILPGKNQNDSSLGWEESKWFFHGVERTKIVGSCHWEESKTILPGTNQDDFSYAGKNHKILQSKMERHKWFFRINGKNQK